ncbi:MAG: hypothetical protein KDI64_20640, partial [Candidatus Accumulibacter sp.]|nr:hypothetical protein [Accumulibacter sp.]
MIGIILGQSRWLLAFILVLLAPQTLAQSDDLQAIISAIEDPYPLRSADRSSPRDSLRTFLRDTSTAADAWRSGKPSADVDRPLLRAAETIDFGEVRARDRLTAITIDMVLLKEILDRVELPPFEDIPDDEEVAEQGIVRWTIPNTKIEIARISEGPNAGKFLFTRDTIAKIRSYYALAKDLPYKKGASVGLYNEYLSTPGPWIPRNFPDRLPDWARTIVLGQGAWQWIALFSLILVSAVFVSFVYRQGARWDEKHRTTRPFLSFGVPLALLCAVAIAYFVEICAIEAIGLYEFSLAILSYIALVVQVGGLACLVLVVAGRLADGFAFNHEGSAEKRRVDAALLRIIFRLVSGVILVYLGIYAAEAVG